MVKRFRFRYLSEKIGHWWFIMNCAAKEDGWLAEW